MNSVLRANYNASNKVFVRFQSDLFKLIDGFSIEEGTKSVMKKQINTLCACCSYSLNQLSLDTIIQYKKWNAMQPQDDDDDGDYNDDDNVTYSQSDDASNSNSNSNDWTVSHECTKCGQSFPSGSALGGHRRHCSKKSKNNLNFKCNDCSKCFSKSRYLRDHVIRMHSDEHHECNECGKGFKLKNDLNHHIRSAHDGCPFECDECHQTFKYSKEFQKHQQSACTKSDLEDEAHHSSSNQELETHLVAHCQSQNENENENESEPGMERDGETNEFGKRTRNGNEKENEEMIAFDSPRRKRTKCNQKESENESEGALYCYDCKGFGEEKKMMECGGCGHWYHHSCIGLLAETATMLNGYKCKSCRHATK